MPLIGRVWKNLTKGEVIRLPDCPPDLEVINVGDGKTKILRGSAWGGIQVEAPVGTTFRIAKDNRDLPGAEPDSPVVKAYKRTFLYTVELGGGKRAEQYPEAE